MIWPQWIKRLFWDEERITDLEQFKQKAETFMTTFSGDVTQLESLVPAVIARDQKSEKDLTVAQGMVTELTKERDDAKANAADPALVHRLEVQIAALTQFMTPTPAPVVTPDPTTPPGTIETPAP